MSHKLASEPPPPETYNSDSETELGLVSEPVLETDSEPDSEEERIAEKYPYTDSEEEN